MQKFMTTCTVLLLAASLAVQVSRATYNTTISVVDSRKKHHIHTCSSFECIEEVLTHSTQIVFNVSLISLVSPFIVQNLTNIALKGTGHTATVHCNPATGLQFTGITNLLIENIIFTECGSRYEHLEVLAALYISSTINCDIRSVTFYNSSGRGVLLLEARGNVSIVNSLFERNGNSTGNGGGVLIKAHTTESCAVNYTIRNCSFICNRAKALDSQQLYGEGGGLSIILEEASNHHICISDSEFVANSAVWGGALHVMFYNQASHNSLTVESTTFSKNMAPKRVGGAVDLGYKIKVNSSEAPYNNTGLFYNCTFTNNTAAYGGGVSIFSSKTFQWRGKKDEFVFRNCTWDGNMGDYGSAVDISPEVWSTLSDGWTPLLPVFEDCTLVNNRLNWEKLCDEYESWKWEQYKTGKGTAGRGTFHVTSFAVEFRGKLLFESNTFSAMYLVGSMVDFTAGTDNTFSKNSGLDGGAIALIGFSALRVGKHSRFTFSNNRAERNGGAIYVWSIDRHDYVSTRSCFIQAQQQPNSINITFRFFDNEAVQGPAMYASSFLPCYFSCSCKKGEFNSITLSELFTDDSIAKFKFEKDAKDEISTPGWKINNTNTEKVDITPGRKTSLSITLQDELDNIVDGIYHAVVIRHPDSNSTIQIEEAHSYIHHKQIEVYGKPNDTAIVELSTLTTRKVILLIEVKMLPCPPGYVIDIKASSGGNASLYQCVCSVNTNKSYMGIRRCNIAKSRAFLQRQYWAGYQGEPSEENLLIGRCPSEDFCQQHYEKEYLLPNTASKAELEKAVCASKRTGVLCSRCKQGYSVHYHATSAKCFETRHCQLSWLFYIVSELVPITVLLVVVMVFNVSFTSGVSNGFILFAQTFHMDLITANRSVWVERWVYAILTKLHFFYRFFNTELFTLDSLSFCLWEDANSLDIVAFKYVTIVYSLLLIGLVVVLTNICNVNRLFHAVSNPRRVRSYIIHGLTAFLILSYSQCTKITLEILTSTPLYGEGTIRQHPVVKRQGDITFFSPAHLVYAIPAIICLVTLVLPPPLLLLTYPAHYKLLRLLRINETKFAHLISLEKMKPLFDSFQGGYRDNYRFFSGVYFLFRFISEIIRAFTTSSQGYYCWMQGLIATLILLHMACRPHRKNWHNILDGVIFLVLLTIHIITMYAFSIVQNKYGTYEDTMLVQVGQTIFSLFPLVFITVYIFGKVLGYYRKKKINKETEFEMETLPARLLSKTDSESKDEEIESLEYSLFVESTAYM